MSGNSNTTLQKVTQQLKKKRVALPLITLLLVIAADILIVSITHGNSGQVDVVDLRSSTKEAGTDSITVMSINMAHGRADGRNQILQSKARIKENIQNIGQLIARHNPQVVALQEADAPSWWSGRFSQVESVGKIGGMKSAVQGLNINGLGLRYGAAVVTQLKVLDARQVTFPKNLPSFSKGFVVVTSSWPGDSSFEFDVVSLHLDFASDRVRSRQLSLLATLVNQRTRPIVLMGDFNTGMTRELLPQFIQETGLTTWQVNDLSIITFPVLNSRIDWIFVSPEFQITEQSLTGEGLSDHRTIVATLERTVE